MTLTLNLSSDLERRVREAADRQGKPAEVITLELLDRHLPSSEADRRARAIALLRAWREEDDGEEQRETWVALRIALDEDRLSDRPLFPDELKGISW